jgi:glycogen debranching enzyme
MSGSGTPHASSARRAPSARHGDFAPTASIADAIVIKDGDLFFLSEPDGSVPLDGHHGLGLYYHDCRFLDGCALTLGGVRPRLLAATAARGSGSIAELTNPPIGTDGATIAGEDLGIRWERTVDAATLTLEDRIVVRNFGVASAAVPIALAWSARFEDVFAVRGMPPGKRGRLHRPRWRDGVLTFAYDGADGIARTLAVHVSPAPRRTQGATARFELAVGAGQERAIVSRLVVGETRAGQAADASEQRPSRPARGDRADAERQWLSEHPSIRSNSLLLDAVVDRSLRDLRVLLTELGQRRFFAAGVPWYVTLFGRDSILAALEALAWEPEIAADTLRLLASFQGRDVDERRGEEPGKILHELRVGEMAHLGEIAQTPYYGSIDSTPLFLILLARHAAWTGELGLFRELRDSADRALRWIADYGDRDHDGYLEYRGSSTKGGLANQGWKDSGDAISNADGTLARPPIALAEVQGYVFAAKRALADLYRRAGDADRADALAREADALAARFDRDFWLRDRGFYALALQEGGRPADVVSSNPGQALWTGIVDPGRASATVARLMASDMFTGWGIRTLSTEERRYNPIGYHVGTVWPHDNALIGGGFRRYRHDEEALRVFAGIVEAAMHFEHNRLPEVFAGFPRKDYEVPVRYPVACHPQAWAAGAVPYLLETCLGLEPEAFERRLRIVRPVLPDFVRVIEIQRLRVGAASVSLRFERGSDGAVRVEPRDVTDGLDVIVDPR